MKIIAQMDEISAIDITKDSTFAILLEAQNLGHEIYYYLPQTLSLEENTLKANIHKIKLQNKIGDHVDILETNFVDITNYDILLVRQDPPFDMNYITSTYLLEKVKDKIKIINDPSEIRNCPEKIFVTDFANFIPPTLISADLNSIKNFKNKYEEIILKPLYGCGGEGINFLGKNDKNIDEIVKLMLEEYKTPIVIQKFIKEVKNGDKRILLLNGEFLGAVNRVAKEGEVASNFHVGGTAHKTTLTKREEQICQKIGPELKKRGLIFVGIDVIGDYVTEINVTSPTGIQEINRLENSKIETEIIKFFEETCY